MLASPDILFNQRVRESTVRIGNLLLSTSPGIHQHFVSEQAAGDRLRTRRGRWAATCHGLTATDELQDHAYRSRKIIRPLVKS